LAEFDQGRQLSFIFGQINLIEAAVGPETLPTVVLPLDTAIVSLLEIKVAELLLWALNRLIRAADFTVRCLGAAYCRIHENLLELDEWTALHVMILTGWSPGDLEELVHD